MININKNLIKINTSKRKDYTLYYDNELINIIEELYNKDITLFNYNYN